MGKTWNDQPDAIADGEVLANVTAGERHCEIRRYRDPIRRHVSWSYSLTTGNLFGSQTFDCQDTDAIFRLLRAISSVKKKLKELPLGVTLMDGAKTGEKQ